MAKCKSILLRKRGRWTGHVHAVNSNVALDENFSVVTQRCEGIKKKRIGKDSSWFSDDSENDDKQALPTLKNLHILYPIA